MLKVAQNLAITHFGMVEGNLTFIFQKQLFIKVRTGDL